MNPNELLPEDYDHPIFKPESFDDFINCWHLLDIIYKPISANQAFRILATFQRMGLAVVQCSDGAIGSVWDIKFSGNGEISVGVDIPENFGLYCTGPSELKLIEIKRP